MKKSHNHLKSPGISEPSSPNNIVTTELGITGVLKFHNCKFENCHFTLTAVCPIFLCDSLEDKIL
jgi:hypothetical protein